MTVRHTTRRLIVTGFGPFGDFLENPSATLARQLGRPCEVLPVSYTAADQFLKTLDGESFDGLVMLGVAGGSQRLRWETTARNWVGGRADINGERRGPGPIEFNAPQELVSFAAGPHGAFDDVRPRGALWEISPHAGDYLCNYLFYRARQRFPQHLTAFIHVPPWTHQDEATQLAALLDWIGTV